jgi:gas vesicle protein
MAKKTSKNNAGTVALFGGLAVAALGAGYVIGTLLAPQSGKETRAKLKTRAEKLADEVSQRVENAKVEVADTADKVSDKVKSPEPDVKQ